MNAPYVSAWDRATTFLLDAAGVTADELRAAASVMSAVAAVDRAPLNRAMTTDSSGNPITDTPEQTEAWSTASEAWDVQERAESWARTLQLAAQRRQMSEAPSGEMKDHVETLALAWAEQDSIESWALAAPGARPISPAALRDIVADYLASHDPFPDGTQVEVARADGSGWDSAVVIDRPGNDEWTVEFDDGEQAWRDHSELRPRR